MVWYGTVWYGPVRCGSGQHPPVQSSTGEYSTVQQYSRIRYGIVWYGMVRYGTVRYRYGTVRYGTVRYGTVRYGTVRCGGHLFKTFKSNFDGLDGLYRSEWHSVVRAVLNNCFKMVSFWWKSVFAAKRCSKKCLQAIFWNSLYTKPDPKFNPSYTQKQKFVFCNLQCKY